MIVILRCNSIVSDSRVKKYIDFFEEKKIEYKVLGWDRNGEGIQLKNTIFYTKNTGYNVGGFNALLGRLLWMIYTMKFLRNNKNISTIHACDVDTAFPAAIYKSIFNKKVKLIFDIFDWFSDTLYQQNCIIRLLFKFVEKYSIKLSDEVIICEPERIKQIPYKLNKKEMIIPNIPSFNDISFLKLEDKYKFNNHNFTLSYVGGFAIGRNLNELLEAASTNKFNLLIAGYGAKDFEEKCLELSRLDNVKYFGKVDYKEGLKIMYNSDLIYAMYSKINPNHFYAAPNKYYEAMMLGKPIISTKGINIEKKILDNKFGYIIDESSDELLNLIVGITKEDVLLKGNNASELWQNKYMNYIDNYFNNTYIKMIEINK